MLAKKTKPHALHAGRCRPPRKRRSSVAAQRGQTFQSSPRIVAATTVLLPRQDLPDQVGARRGDFRSRLMPIELRLDRRSLLAELFREQPELDHVLVAVWVREMLSPPALFHVAEKPVEAVRRLVVTGE